jgi:hypothetical protein
MSRRFILLFYALAFFVSLSLHAKSKMPSQAIVGSILKQLREQAHRYHLDEAMVIAVAFTESSFDPKAVSSSGARGVMQLKPELFRQYGIVNPFNPRQNIAGGVRYLSDLLKLYGGRWDLALSAYNGGPGRLDRHIIADHASEFPDTTSEGISSCLPSTQYVRKVFDLAKEIRTKTSRS